MTKLLPNENDRLIWSTKWGATRSGVSAGCAGITNEKKYKGLRSAYLKISKGSENSSVELEQYISLIPYKGKRIQLEAFISMAQNDGVLGRAFIEATLNPGTSLGNNSRCQSEAIVGQKDWQKVNIAIDVRDIHEDLRISAVLHDHGTAWYDEIKITEIGLPTEAVLYCQDSLSNRNLYGSNYVYGGTNNKLLNGDFEDLPKFAISAREQINCFLQ